MNINHSVGLVVSARMCYSSAACALYWNRVGYKLIQLQAALSWLAKMVLLQKEEKKLWTTSYTGDPVLRLLNDTLHDGNSPVVCLDKVSVWQYGFVVGNR